MGSYLQILTILITGTVLLWFGYTILFGPITKYYDYRQELKNYNKPHMRLRGSPGDPQICPVCSTKLIKGELVKSHAFPSISGGKDRLMYIKGCLYCLEDNFRRLCPVCNYLLTNEDYLISRMFDRSTTRKHVHVMGCNYCKMTV
jgi:hypothetical protein